MHTAAHALPGQRCSWVSVCRTVGWGKGCSSPAWSSSPLERGRGSLHQSFSFKLMITWACLPFSFLATRALLYLLKMSCAKQFPTIMLHFLLKMWWCACRSTWQYMGTVPGEVQAEIWVWSSLWYYLRCTCYPSASFGSLLLYWNHNSSHSSRLWCVF